MRYDYVILEIAGVLAIGYIFWHRLFPDTSTLHHTVELLNTKGGIIFLLWLTSMIFFFVGMRLVYWGENMIVEHKLDTDNALILSAFNWITGAAFGGAFGAMIKTMTGEESPKPDNGKRNEPPSAS